MTQQAKPSAGALRAAERLTHFIECCAEREHITNLYRAADIQRIAAIVDAESGLAELLEAAQRVAKWIDAGCDPSTKSLEALQRAIAKAINPNATVQQVAPLGRWTDKKGTV